MIPLNYDENLEKVKYIYNKLNIMNKLSMNSLIFTIRNSSCLVVNKDCVYEIEFFDNYDTSDTTILCNTSKIDFYRLMLFITDNIRVKSQMLSKWD